MVTSITDWNDLDDIRNNLSGDYVLENDLDSNTTGYDSVASSTANSNQGFLPLGDVENTSFTGTFDGQGYTISDLVSKPDSRIDNGIFGFSENATVSNLNVVNADVDTNGRSGILGGTFASSTVENIFTSGTVVVGLYEDGFTQIEFGGGVCAGGDGSTIKNCYSIASVEAQDADGQGIGSTFGAAENTDFTNCYGTGNLITPTDSFAGGFIGLDNGGCTFDGCYWDTETTGYTTSDGGTGLTTSEMSGDSASSNLPEFNFSSIWTEVIGGEFIGGYPVESDGYPILLGNENLIQLQGQGVVASGIFIEDWNDLDDIRNALNEDYSLLNDLDKNTPGYDGIGNDWNPIRNFGGSLDGQGNAIYDLQIDIRDRPEDTPCGFFETLDENQPVTIQNISIIEADVKNASESDVFTTPAETGTGILFGSSYQDNFPDTNPLRDISNCVFTGSVEANTFAGGISSVFVSENSSIDSVIVDVDIITKNDQSLTTFSGGLTPYFAGDEITDCLIDVSIQCDGNCGGVVGDYRGDKSVKRTAVKVDIVGGSGDGTVGGVVGSVSDTNVTGITQNCFAVGQITSDGDDIGGILGQFNTENIEQYIRQTYAAVELGGNASNKGGIIGDATEGTNAEPRVIDGYWDTEISGVSSTAQGEGTGLTTSEMVGTAASNNMNFDFSSIWSEVTDPVDSYPRIIQSLDGSDHPYEQEQFTILDANEFWAIGPFQIGNTLEEVREYQNLTLELRYENDKVETYVNSLKSKSSKVDTVDVSSGGFRGVDLLTGRAEFEFNSPAQRSDVRSVDRWLLSDYSETAVNTSASVFDIELELIPVSEKRYDNEFGTFDSEPIDSKGSSEWSFNFNYGQIATSRISVGVSEVAEGSADRYGIETVLTPKETRILEENLGFLNTVVLRTVPDSDDVLDDTSQNSRNTVEITPANTESGTLTSGEYIVETFETEWIGGAYRIEFEVGQT